MLPGSAVPAIVSLVSFERPLSGTVPVTGATLSVTVTITGATGADVSMVTWNAVEAALWLPAASVAFNVRVWAPSLSAEVVIGPAPPIAWPVPTSVVPS